MIKGGEVIYLSGELGTGKTTFARGFLAAAGYKGKVKSPTYGLIETYSLDGFDVHHFDLYRLHGPEELEQMGIRDYCTFEAVCLFEWPERGGDMLPSPDIRIHITHDDECRRVRLEAESDNGLLILGRL